MPEDNAEEFEDTIDASTESSEQEEDGVDASEAQDETIDGSKEETDPDEADDDALDKESVPNDDNVDNDESEESDDSEESADGPALPLTSVVEAVLFAAREPLKLAHIARAVGKRTRQETVRDAIDELNVHYLETSRSFEIAEISGRYQLMSRPEFVGHIMKIYPKKELVDKEKSNRLTPAALDTLAIISYKQPVTRADIERIRGVGCGPVLRALMERGSVRIAGKRTDLVGQPLLYGTTDAFLVEFGLGSLDELPLRSEFLGMLGEEPPPMEPVADDDDGEGDEETREEEPAVPEPTSDDASAEIVPEADEEPESDADNIVPYDTDMPNPDIP